MGTNPTTCERRSEREVVITRLFDSPPHRVYEAWARPELFQRWWSPRSRGVPLFSCDMDVRPGGAYRLAFGHDAVTARAFFGKYLEVVPPSRLVWTNEEAGDDTTTTVTFQPADGGTRLVLQERYPTKEAADESFASMEATTPEQFAQLDALLSVGN